MHHRGDPTVGTAAVQDGCRNQVCEMGLASTLEEDVVGVVPSRSSCYAVASYIDSEPYGKVTSTA